MTRSERTVRVWNDDDWQKTLKAWRATEKVLREEGRPVKYRK